MSYLPKKTKYVIPNNNEIKSNKTHWKLDIDSAALLIHDMQKYFINSFDRLNDPLKTVVNNISLLAIAARKANMPVFYTAQLGNQDPKERGLAIDFWGPGLSDDPSLTSIIDELAPQAGDIRLDKWRYSAFKKSEMQNILLQKKRNQLIITGVYGHIGCLNTALEAFMLDIKPFVLIDAIADFSREEHIMAGSYVAQRCGIVLNTQQVLECLR